jgi:hypothetical protein
VTDVPFGGSADAADSGDFADFDGYELADSTTDSGAASGEAQAPADFAPPVTGNARVDDATAALEVLDDRPTADHADVFEDVHRRLQSALADLDGD